MDGTWDQHRPRYSNKPGKRLLYAKRTSSYCCHVDTVSTSSTWLGPLDVPRIRKTTLAVLGDRDTLQLPTVPK